MPAIELVTIIKAPIEICFDLSRSIDLHKISTAHTHEQAIRGKTTGLIALHETVTWQAVHFGIKQQLTSKITAYERPYYFVDEQIKGAFKSFHHEHIFEKQMDTVVMKDVFTFKAPLGILGVIFNKLILIRYLKKLLLRRNSIIKEYAETNKWMHVLKLDDIDHNI
jgi:ligand-binding SRPBCC domain-containing protein